MNPILVGFLAGVALAVARMVAVWALLRWPYPPEIPTRDLRLSSEAPTMVAREARRARGIQT